MGIRSLSAASISTGAKRSKFWDQTTEAYLASFESITSTSLTASTSTVTFSSIPSTYTHLQLRVVSRSTTAGTGQDGLRMRFNGDSVARYSWHYIGGDGATAYSGNGASQTYAYPGVSVNNGFTSSAFGLIVCDILDYKNTNKFTTTRSISGGDNNGNGETYIWSSSWQQVDAITSIELALISGASFVASSQFALYGIKGA